VDIANVRAFSVGYRDSSRNKVLAEALMLTEDENIVDLQFDVQYRIKAGVADVDNGGIDIGKALSPAASYLFATADPDESVRQAAETAMREVVGKESMNNILYESRTQAAQDVMRLMQSILDRYNTGIEVITVAIQNVQPPEQVQAAFEDAIKAGQDNERQKNEGQAYASRVIPEAHGRASRFLQSAEGYRARVVGAAIGETERFKQIAAEYTAAPEITRERMYIEAMGDIYSNTSKILLDTAEQQNPLMLMPLDSMLNRSSTRTAPTVPATPTQGASDASLFDHGNGTTTSATTSSSTGAIDPRSRELSRDREDSARR
ncbi:MAG: FtsH protease activity modulator HflK, partial [Alcaligenaceae bacterium]|nr:FtsH protease activity modulator HflK [Alcaligenaceae bacterium]